MAQSTRVGNVKVLKLCGDNATSVFPGKVLPGVDALSSI